MSPEGKQPAIQSATQWAHILAIAAVMWAAIAFRVVANDGYLTTWMLLLIIGVEFILAVVIAIRLRKIPGFSSHPSQQATCVVIWVVGALLFRVIQRLCGVGFPWELVLMSGARHLMLALIVCGCTLRLQRLAVMLSLFLIVFTASLTSRANAAGILAVYCIPASAWLLFQEWQRFSGRLLDSESVGPRKRWLVWTIPLVGLLIAGFSFADDRALQQVRGWFPSSGGDGGADPLARDGVGDGDALVPGEKNIKSIAPLEDAPFLEDDQPSLYDVFDDTYEKATPPKKTEKAVSLDPTEFERGCERIAKNEHGAREFSTLRKDNSGSRHRLQDKTSHAQFHVAGRVPLHLRAEVYDLFDGISWYPVPPADPPIRTRIQKIGERHWLTLSSWDGAWFSQPEYHVLKMIRYGSPVIPTPVHATGVHIDRIDREDMYLWQQPGVPALDRRKMAPLIAIRLASKVADRELVPVPKPITFPVGDHSQQVPDVKGAEAIAALADSWAQDCEPGWDEVDAILDRLRSDYIHDRSVSITADEQAPVLGFLTKVKAGPDYQFATAAALLLRSRGYRCRVVSGYYADPENYDRKTRLTSVYDDDVHFWVELYTGLDTWVTLDPTPGYELLTPPRTWVQQVWAAFASAGRWMGRNPVTVAAMVVACLLLWWCRVPIQNAALTVSCFSPFVQEETRCFATFHLIDKRLGWAGVARPEHCSPKQWWAQVGLLDQDGRQLLDRIEARVFAGRNITEMARDESGALCRRLLSHWNLSALKARAQPTSHESSDSVSPDVVLEST